MNKKYEKTIEWIVLSCLLISYCVLTFVFFSINHFEEGILFSLIPIVLMLVIKLKLEFFKELALISLCTLIVSYFVLTYFLFKTNYVWIGILLILLFICFIYIIKSKKKIVIVLLDSLYSFFRFLLVNLIVIIFVVMFVLIFVLFYMIISSIMVNDSESVVTPALIYNL